MKNLNLLLNRSGMSPDVTSRKSRHALESIVSRFSLVSLICLCMLTIGIGNAWGTCTTVATRTFGSSDWTTGHTVYTDTWSDLSCDFNRAANNNKAWDYVRLAVKGGSDKDATNTKTCYIRYNTAINNVVSKVIINHAGTTDAIGTNLAINWVALSVYNGAVKVDSVTILAASLSFSKNVAGTIEFTPTSGDTWASGYKYYFYANIFCKGNSNRGLNVSSLQFDNCESVSGYSITYHCNDATSDCPSNASGQTALPSPLPTPTKTGFTFGGWYTDASFTSAASAGATLNANADLYAKWTCNVTLNRNGATETINNVVEGTDLDDIDGSGDQGGCSAWTFIGWSKTQRAAQNNSTAMTLVTDVDGAGPYYAVFSHTEGGGGGGSSTETLTFGTSYASNGSSLTSVTICTGITASATDGDSNNPKFYTSSPGTWRIYTGSELTISSSIGDIKEISFSYNSDFHMSLKAGEAGSLSSTIWTDEDAGGVTSVTFSCTGTNKLSAIAVTYSDGSTTYYSTTATCSAASTWKFKYDGDSWATTHTMSESAGVASYSISLAADSRFEFGFDDNGSAFYKNNGTIITTTSGWTFSTDAATNCHIHTGPAGTYTFAINTTSKSVTVTYPTVDHPNEHYVYFKNTNVWGTVYGYLGNTGNDNKAAAWPGSVMQPTTTICGETYHYAALNAMSGTYNVINFNNGGSGYGNQTSDLSTDGLGKYNANQDANWHDLNYTITFAGNGSNGGSMSNVSGICPGTNSTLASNGFTKTGYAFTGWTANAAVTIGGESVSAGTLIPDASTLQSISGNITLTAQWELTADYVLVESAGDIGDGDYLIVYNNTYALNTHNGNINANTYGTYTDISSYYSSKTIESNSTTDALAFTVEATTNGYSFYKEGEGTYLGNSSTGTGAKLRWDDTFTAEQNEWTLAPGSMVSVYDDSKAIRWNNASGSYRFAIYDTDGQEAIQLFRKASTGPTTTITSDLGSFTYERGKGPSAAQTFTVKGKGLTGNLTVTAPSNYQVSLDGGDWSTAGGSKTITASGTLTTTAIYVRLAEGLSVNSYNGNISISGGGATTKNVAVTGSVTCATPILSFASGVVTKYADAANFTNPLTISGVDPSDVTVTYSSSDGSKATVNSSGEVDVKAVTADGTPVTITASVASVAGANCSNAAVASYSLVIGYKITWMVNGEEYTEGSPTLTVASGGAVDELPAAPDGTATCGNKVFVGWSASSISGTTNTRPADLFIIPSGAPTITENKTFYAVFATEGGNKTSFTRITSSSDWYPGQKIVIVANNNNKMLANDWTGGAAPEEVSSKITVTDSKYVWTIGTNDGPYGSSWYQLSSGNVVLSAADGVTSDKKYQYIEERTDDNAYYSWWALDDELSTSNCFALYNDAQDDDDDGYTDWISYLEWYNSGSKWETYYTTDWSSSKEYLFALRLYKSNVTYSQYATTCTTPHIVTVNSAGHGSAEADPIYVVDGESTTITLTPDAGYQCSSVTKNSGTATEGTLSGCSYTLTNIRSDVDLTATFTKAPVYNVTFNAGEGKVVGYNSPTATLTETTRTFGVTAPTATSCADAWTFAYWSTTNQTSATTTPPAHTADAMQKYVPDEDNRTLYAVYKNTDGATYTYGTDAITVSDLAATNTTYQEFSNVAKTTAARYAGKSGKNHSVIALNSTKPAGIVSTTSGGTLSQVKIYWDDNTTENRTIAVYGYNTPYVDSYDIYGTSTTQPKGVKLGELTYDGSTATSTLDVTGSYAYVGIRSKQNAVYVSQIDIKWITSASGIQYNSRPVCDECEEPTFGFELSSVTLTAPRVDTYTNTFTSDNTNTAGTTYSSSNTSVAVVNNSGAVTVKGKGTTTISVHQNRMTSGTTKYCAVDDSYELIVNEAGVEVVEVNNNNDIIIEHDFGGETNVLIDQLTLHEEGKKADEVFFSKYFEATGSVKLVAVYNGTGKSHDPSKYRIRCASTSASTQHIIKVGDYIEEWPNGKELIFYSWDTSNSADLSVMTCVNGKNDDGQIDMSEWISIPWSGYTPTKSAIIFGGSDAVVLEEYDGSQWNILDIIGALTPDGKKADGTNLEGTGTITWGDGSNKGWYCSSGRELGGSENTNYALSTLRCLLVRKFDVLSGTAARNSTTGNLGTGYFNTLCTEWYGKQVTGSTREENNASACASFSEVGNFNYYDAYQKYEPITMGFSATPSNPWDGTMTVHINPDIISGGLAGLSCNYLKIKVTNAAQTKEYASVEYKVPIIVSGSKSTTDDIFDFEDCSICDVAILQGGTLTAATGGKNEVSDVEVYRGAKLSIPSGQEYTVNNLYLRSQGDVVPQLDVIGTLNRANTKLYFDKRVDESRWYWMTLPYDCAVKDVTLRNGETPTYGIDNTWVLQTYDGRKRANTQAGGCWEVYNGEKIQKGVGYILGITPKSGHDFVELRFPMTATEWDKDRATISVPVMGTKGASEDVPVNHRGWNMIGNPYLTNYSKGHIGETTAGSTGTNIIPQGVLTEVIGTGFHYDGETRYVNIPVGGGYSEYSQVAIGDQGLPPFMSYFIQIEGSDGVTSYVKFSNTLDQQNYVPVRRAPAEYAEEDTHPVWVPFNLTNNKGESDETTLLVSNRFTDGYEMMDDLIKWRGDYYQYAVITTKPVLATRNSSGEMAFNALPDTSASVTGIPVNFFAAYAGDYTFSINGKYGLEEVKEAQLWDKTTGQYYDLLANDYSFSAPRGDNTDRFILYVRVERKKAPNTETDIDNVPTEGQLNLMAVGKTLVLSGITNNADVYVYDMSGKLVVGDHASGNTGVWRTTVPASGVYFVRVNGIGEQQTLQTIVY